MTHSVYICEDFQLKNGILTIWDAKEVAKVNDVEGFHYVMNSVNYNAIVCPYFLRNKFGGVNIILFV